MDNQKIVQEDIRAEVEKTNSILIFSALVLFMILIGFWVKQCAGMPKDLEPSVECFKAGGQWIPEIKNDNGYIKVTAYCSREKIK